MSTRKPYLIGSGVDGQLYEALLGPGHHETAGSIMSGGQLVCPLCAALSRAVGAGKEFIIKMEGNTGELSDISGSEIHGGRCVQSIR